MKTDHEKLAEMIKDIKFAIMTTIDTEGKMHARPMATMNVNSTEEFDGSLWFFTRLDSLKVHNIEDEHDVSLAYSHPTNQRYVSVTGTGVISQDKNKMKELWTPTLKAWFPEGLQDPQIALIKVTVEGAEIWDSPPSTVVKLFGMAKAVLTGKTFDKVGDHREIGKIH